MATSRTRQQRPESVMSPGFRRKSRRNTALTGSAAVVNRGPSISVPIGHANPVGSATEWEDEAWRQWDINGELRAGTTWIANALSRVNLIAARVPRSVGDEPTPLNPEENPGDQVIVDLVADIAGGPVGQGALLSNAALHLVVPGCGYMLVTADLENDEFSDWRVLGKSEVRRQRDGSFEMRSPESGAWVPVPPADLLIKFWRSHPNRSWQSDSPVRAVLGILKQIEMLDAHIVATAESRLAGNGLLIMPKEAEFVSMPGMSGPVGSDPDDPDAYDDGDSGDFMENLTEAMETPITDRSAPSARVPVGAQVPGEHADKFKWLTFSSPFDARVMALREAAVKRLALGLDMPPEVLTGMGGANHWTAWQVQEEAITLHVEPLAELIVHALTISYLRDQLLNLDLDPDEYMVWYDTTDLKTRPDLSAAVVNAYDRGEASGAALRAKTGLDEDDAPDPEELAERILRVHAETDKQFALAWMAYKGITLPVMPAIDTTSVPSAPGELPAGDTQPPDRGIPERSVEPDTASTDAALLAACDGLVTRALERVGARLRSAAGKKLAGGAAAIPCHDVARLHVELEASKYAEFDHLMSGVWDRVPAVAHRYRLDPDVLTNSLDTYVRGLLGTGHPHEYDHLAYCLGVSASV